ncbi:FIST signal transduction protein [Pseudobacteroides cellulosolvens]|uniref:FIST domain-containing protein n=1 Tax=Pseudobacteroides cellulosolvens ATCC 35603 = DSM 2933 TaxID=398512 RepID=A0A0L6JTK4_9FIRM|nr:FIST N-terminal domain-containing protein [Pseudobacteroides cellulosolvens]KNY29181.1 protein of unknown function DUF1745 [Pseudobacteroides cellulosolvens ATCC 35603 = DSM 2933]
MLDIKNQCSNNPNLDVAVEEIVKVIKSDNTKLVLFYVSPTKYDFSKAAQLFKNVFPECDVVGCTSAGEIGNKGLVEGHISATSFSSDKFEVSSAFLKDVKSKALLGKPALLKAAQKVGISPDNEEEAFAIMHIDGLSAAEEKVLSVFGGIFKTLPLVGGSAGDDLTFDASKNMVALNGEVSTNAAVLTFVKTKHKFFMHKEDIYRPTNHKFMVTKADVATRTVYELDGRPAAEVYAESIGVTIEDLPKHFMHHPMGRIFQDNVWITSPSSTDGKAVSFYCTVLPNTPLALLEWIDPMQEIDKSIEILKENLPDCRGIFMSNCIFRLTQFKSEGSVEKVSDKYLKLNIPICGFNTYGEQLGRQHMNQSLTFIAFGD